MRPERGREAAESKAAPDAGPPPLDVVVYGRPFALGSARAVGVMRDEHGVDEKSIVLSDRDVPCDQAWTADRTDTAVTMSFVPWVDGGSKTYTADGFEAATLDGYDPAFDWVDGGVRSFVIVAGTVTTIRAGTGPGTTGRVRFDLHATEGDDHAVGEVDVLQCE